MCAFTLDNHGGGEGLSKDVLTSDFAGESRKELDERYSELVEKRKKIIGLGKAHPSFWKEIEHSNILMRQLKQKIALAGKKDTAVGEYRNNVVVRLENEFRTGDDDGDTFEISAVGEHEIDELKSIGAKLNLNAFTDGAHNSPQALGGGVSAIVNDDGTVTENSSNGIEYLNPPKRSDLLQAMIYISRKIHLANGGDIDVSYGGGLQHQGDLGLDSIQNAWHDEIDFHAYPVSGDYQKGGTSGFIIVALSGNKEMANTGIYVEGNAEILQGIVGSGKTSQSNINALVGLKTKLVNVSTGIGHLAHGGDFVPVIDEAMPEGFYAQGKVKIPVSKRLSLYISGKAYDDYDSQASFGVGYEF